MVCPRCGLPMRRRTRKNGETYWECSCGHIEETKDLDVNPCDKWEENNGE